MNDKIYALICYQILMNVIETKSPLYIWEKFAMVNEGLNAFAYLDYINKKRAIEYCQRWRIEVPEIWLEAEKREKEAAIELGLENPEPELGKNAGPIKKNQEKDTK